MIEAVRQCEEEGFFFRRLFRYQYVISMRPLDVPQMRRHLFSGVNLYRGDATSLTRLNDSKGTQIGLLLGIAVAPEGLLGESHDIPGLDAEDPAAHDRFEEWLVDLAGRYTILLCIGTERRIYSDPVGMNGVVYNPVTRRVAASPLLCIDREVQPNPLFDHDLMASEGGRLSLFQTRDAEVMRMNPSFYLDLENFQEIRHWPRDAQFHHDPADYPAAIDKIIATARHNIGAIAAQHQTAMPLSGGRDSRLLLAMTGEQAHRIGQIFTHVTNFSTQQDSLLAGQLTETLGLPHEVHHARNTLRGREARLAEKSARGYQIASGVLTAAPDELRTRVQIKLKANAVVLRGHQTDMLRAVFVPYADKHRWKDLDWQIRKLLIVPGARFDENIAKRFRPLYSNWLKTLPPAARDKQPDFLFLEIFYSNSLGTMFPALSHAFYMSPFNSRRLIALSLGFDDAYRIAGHPVNDILARCAPRLLDIRFNTEHPDDTGAVPSAVERKKDALARHAEMFGPQAEPQSS